MKTNNFKKIRTIIFILVVTTILSMLPVSSAVVLPTEEDEPIISSRLENEMDNVSSSAKIDVNLWFNDNSQREIFVNTIFDVIEATDAKTNSEIEANALKNSVKILTAIRKLDPSLRKKFDQALRVLFNVAHKKIPRIDKFIASKITILF